MFIARDHRRAPGLLGWNPDGDWLGTGVRGVAGIGFLVCLGVVRPHLRRGGSTPTSCSPPTGSSTARASSPSGRTDIPLERVNTVFFNQGPLERLVGAGDLKIESASESGANEFRNVRRPNIVQKEIYTQMEANENRKFDRMGQASHDAAAGHRRCHHAARGSRSPSRSTSSPSCTSAAC